MSHVGTDEEYTLVAEKSTRSDCTSILEWIKHIDTPATSPSTSQYSLCFQLCPARSAVYKYKRRRDSDSLPSEFLGDKRSSNKRRKVSQSTSASMTQSNSPSSKYTPNLSGQPKTPTNRSTSSKSVAGFKDLKDAETVGQMMTEKHLMHNDRVAFNRYPLFKDKIMSIVGVNRDSPMRPESHKKFEEYLDCYERSNEATFLRKIFPLLMKDGYHLKRETDFGDVERQLFGKREYLEYRDFLMEEGIVESVDPEFLKTLVPNSCNKDSEIEIAKLLAKVAGMTNPKPDFTFGIRKENFPSLEDAIMPDYIAALLGIVPSMNHAFLIIEGKPDTGSQAEAENQAQRGGATIVHAERKLHELIGDPVNIQGPDEDCFIFSVTLTPKIAEIWVNWYEGKGPKEPGFFHMNRIASLALNDEDSRTAIRSKLHNIMEWGGISSARFNKKLQLRQSIHACVRNEHATKKAAAAYMSADGKASGFPQKKQKTVGSMVQEIEK
jgi:hypothetical protein